MSIAETIYAHCRQLPEQAAEEALRYIQRLEQRHGIRHQGDSDEQDTEAFLAAIAGGFGSDFPDDISLDDLGQDSPRPDWPQD